MGLKADRWISQHTKETIPNWEKKIQDLCGFKIQIEGDWKSFEKDEDGLDYFENSFVEQFYDALRHVCRDDLGKQAVKKKIKKFKAVTLPEGGKKSLKLEEGTLTVQSRISVERNTDNDIVAFLEKNL